MEGGSRGDADEDAFCMGEVSADGECVFVVDGHDLVIDGGVEGVGDEACADALNLMRSCLAAREDGRSGWLDADYLDVLVLLLEVCACAADGAACADACNEDVYFAFGILPDLNACGLHVSTRIGEVGELPREEAVLYRTGKLFGFGDGACHAFRSFGEDDLCAVCTQEVLPFDAHCLGHRHDSTVAARGSDSGKSDACVAARRLDDGGACLEESARFSIVEHLACDAVFHTSRRVKIFQFCQYRGF